MDQRRLLWWRKDDDDEDGVQMLIDDGCDSINQVRDDWWFMQIYGMLTKYN